MLLRGANRDSVSLLRSFQWLRSAQVLCLADIASHAEVRYPNRGTAFRTDRCELLVWNSLHAAVSSNNNVARRQVVLQRESVSKVAVTRDGANPILAIEPFRVKVHGQKPVINVKNKIELSTFPQFRNTGVPGKEFKQYLVTVPILPAQAWEHNCADIVGTGNAKVALLLHRIEETRRDQILHPRQQSLELLENLAAPQRKLETLRRADQKVVLKHRPGALQRPAHRRLAQQQPRYGRSNAFFLLDRGKCNQEV